MSSIRARWALLGLFAGCLLTTGVFLLLRSFQFPPSNPRQALSAPVVLRQIQQLSQLVTVKYALQQVVGFEEKKVPLGSEKMLLFVQAEVLAGVELDKLSSTDVTLGRPAAISITLPPPRILHIVIDDNQTKVWDRRITWWTPWVPYNPDLERQARLSARAAVEKAALEMGILDAARQNAETAIRQFVQNLGFRDVAFMPPH